MLIAGGVGITPVRARCWRNCPAKRSLVYRVATDRDAVLYDELRDLAHTKGAELHLVTGPAVP
ncbi:hypothetical protein LV779_10515 [Streptomyces thinghirensis]|nr:hypothetical protein [Streptomyces thinghirensis]